MKPNVVLLVVDALMPSRTGLSGHLPALTPELTRLAEESLFCNKTFSMGNPTEFALPGLFASSYLLDAGGCSQGIASCGRTLAEELQDDGYQTAALFPIYRPSSHGYERGFDQFFHLYDANVVLKNFSNAANWYRDQYYSGDMDEHESLDSISKTCGEYIDDLARYCGIWRGYRTNPLIPDSLLFDGIDFRSFESEIERERDLFESNRIGYVRGFLQGEALGFVRTVEAIVEKRLKSAPTSLLDLRFRSTLLRNLYSIWSSATSYQSAKNCFALALHKVVQGHQRWTKYPSAGFVFRTFQNWTGSLDRSRPFYAYIHIEDVHEANYYSYDVVGEADEKQREMDLLRQALREIRQEKDYEGHVLYDCSIRYVDHMISRLREFLRTEQLLENTILVVTSDHGGSYPNIPVRDHITAHRVDCFYDELYHVPLIFSGGGAQAVEHTGMVSSIDVAPTILEMVGVSVPTTFRGHPITEDQPFRDHVLMENQGRGPCDLSRKPVRVCVRTERRKIVYEAESVLENDLGRIIELYDLENDPEEQDNKVSDTSLTAEVEEMRMIAQRRVSEIRQMAHNRVRSEPESS